MASPWWSRPGLGTREGRLFVAGRDAEAIAREQGTPVVVYDLVRIEEQARSLVDAFERVGAPFRLRFALKAQREPEVLAFVRGLGAVGIDACSPGEVRHAREHGWSVDEISFTGTNLSATDVDALLDAGVHVNLDLLSQLERWGRRAPGTSVGIRVNPRAGASWSGLPGAEGESLYAKATATKFGVLLEQLDDAIAIAANHELTIDTVHAHVGDGFLTDGLPRFGVAIERVADMTRRVVDAGHEVREVNVGGGLGVPQRSEDETLDVDAYAELLTKHLGPLGVTIACEPGDYLAKESGILLAEVVTLDERDGVWFAGLDAGFNVAPEHFIYGALVPIVLCRAADADPTGTYTVAGNINEGNDLWGEDVRLPELAEGDVLALLLVGAYGRSMHIEHCLRPPAGTVAFTERI
jgi:diaminopimelate decarboxylase